MYAIDNAKLNNNAGSYCDPLRVGTNNIYVLSWRITEDCA